MPSPKRVLGGRAPQLDFAVTAEMIENAIPQDSSHCMIADGLKTAIPHARQVAVDLAAIRYTDSRNGRRYIYLTPAPAQIALLRFDNGEKPGPFQVKMHAAQIIEPKRKKGEEKVSSPSLTDAPGLPGSEALSAAGPSLTETPGERVGVSGPSLTATDEKPERARNTATMIPNPAGGGTVPIKLGGNPPPLGPLARGVGTNKTGPRYRIGRRREFGLRVMGH